ncbi:thymidylate synthase [Candidatus Dojkabacteria bacterium]|jgi:thymidylate synthase|nr:thymidylate synthase [Candidatus Dojkabacteria bacterium]
MKQYQDLLKDILTKGTWKNAARENLPRTKSLFGTRMEFDMADGFPLLTTKKIYYKAIIVELLWFLKGDTNIKYLVDNGCNIWNQDAYRWYLKNAEERGFYPQLKTIEEFVDNIKNGPINSIEVWDSQYKLGDLGKVYGDQWRNQNGVDQLKTVIDRLNSNPMGRYAILDAWNPSDFSKMALPPCHLLYQFNCRKIEDSKIGESMYYLDLQMYQRSVDQFLGCPFNIASASLLLHIISKAVNMIPSNFVWVGGDTHIYENHLDQVNEQLLRNPLELCKLEINKDIKSLDDILSLEIGDISIIDYKYHAAIKAELKTGL